MYGISTGVVLTKGYKESMLTNYKDGNAFQVPNTDCIEIDQLIEKRFFEKKNISKDLFQFLSDNRMIYKIHKGIEHHFPKQIRKYESRHQIEYATYTYAKKQDVKKVIEICNTFLIPNLILQLEEDIINDIEKLIQDKQYPESVTIVSENKTITSQKNRFRILIETKDNRPFVHRDAMDFNYSLFIESQFRHNYFNKKIHIESNGAIKNTPASLDIFSNLNDSNFIKTIATSIKSEKFQKYWNVHKNVCDVCKDCEFKYMCVDNRVPHQRKENEWYHKTACNYNPYLAKWKGEKGYKTLEETGIKSNKKEFSIQHNKRIQINKKL